jgi:hypothetical protein
MMSPSSGPVHRAELSLATATLLFFLAGGCASIQLSDIETPQPVPESSCLIVGFLGGRDAWNDESKGVRQMAVRLKSTDDLFAETFENRRRDVALDFVVQALDRDRSGEVGPHESRDVTTVVYGQSFGGAAVVKFARQLQKLRIPIHLTVQIDSVGLGDGTIPANVKYAANLYQDNGWFISGEHPIDAANPSQTVILGNWKFDYDQPPGVDISVEDLPWHKTAFRVAHAKMDRDPRVWALAEELVRAACSGADLKQVSLNTPREYPD